MAPCVSKKIFADIEPTCKAARIVHGLPMMMYIILITIRAYTDVRAYVTQWLRALIVLLLLVRHWSNNKGGSQLSAYVRSSSFSTDLRLSPTFA